MSLVITSNIPKDDDLRPDTSNTFKPYSYQNRLLNTMKIPPMSEIALESCKITKNGLLSISAENSVYSAFFGPVNNGPNLDASTTQPTFGISGPEDAFVGGGRVERNPADFARDITTGLGSAVYHPALVTGVGTSGVVATVNVDATDNDFKGFKWTSDQNTDVTKKTAAFTYQDITPDQSGDFTVSGIGNEILTSTSTQGFYVQNRQQSISQMGGEVVIDFGGAIAPNPYGFHCGLSRINTNKGFGTGGFAPESYVTMAGDGQPFRLAVGRPDGLFFDICVSHINGKLRVYQAVTLSGSSAVIRGDRQRSDLVMQEVIYYSTVFGVAPFNTELAFDNVAKRYTKAKFTLSNEHIRIDVWDTTTSKYQLLVDNIATTAAGATLKNNVTRPRTASQWNMYPTIHARGAVATPAVVKLEYVQHYTAQPEYDPLTYTKYNWWGHLEAGGLTRWARDIDIRPWNNASDPLKLVPKLLGDDDEMAGYVFQLIMMPSVAYGQAITQGANTSQIFGFQNQPVAFAVAGNIDGANQFFSSNQVPRMTSTSSIFVRLNNFTQQSVNARQGTVSKIIAHLPRFDNAGNETGGLFFQPGERTYVALNNPDTLFVNSFDVDYVYDNETLCKAISGKSITVFHIRKALV